MSDETKTKKPKRTRDQMLIEHRESARADVDKLEQRLTRARTEIGVIEGKLKTAREQLSRLEKATGVEREPVRPVEIE